MKDYLPIAHQDAPSKDATPPGRVFDFSASFTHHQINFHTPLEELSSAIAGFSGQGGYFTDPANDNKTYIISNYHYNPKTKKVSVPNATGTGWHQTTLQFIGTYQPYSCNGPHHALIVAHFSCIVASEMLKNAEMKQIIDEQILTLPSNAQQFLTADDYQNYKKIIEIMALLHDTGRPSDGIDQWDDTNEINVITNVGILLKTTGLTDADQAAIMKLVTDGIKYSDGVTKNNDGKPGSEDIAKTGFLFGCPMGAGDSLHTGHAFRGGVWGSCFSAEYIRLYKNYPGFQNQFLAIVKEARKFVPDPAQNTPLCAVKKYLALCPGNGLNARYKDSQTGQYVGGHYEYDGPSVLKPFYAHDIWRDFSRLDTVTYPIMANYAQHLHPLVVEDMNDGKSGQSVQHLELPDGRHRALKQVKNYEQTIDAFLVGHFLRQVLENHRLTVDGQNLSFHTPASYPHHTDFSFLQDYIPKLNSHTQSNKKIQGLASIDSVVDAGKFGAIFQFLMLGDNIAHNIRISGENFCIFDYDSAFIWGEPCETSQDGIFCDKIAAKDGCFNNDYLDILALKFGQDKYRKITTGESYLAQTGTETWHEFFSGVKQGLELIKNTFHNGFDGFIKDSVSGLKLSHRQQEYLQKINDLFKNRFANLETSIQYIECLLNGRIVIDGFDINSQIANASIIEFIDSLREKIKTKYTEFAKQKYDQGQKATDLSRELDEKLKTATTQYNASLLPNLELNKKGNFDARVYVRFETQDQANLFSGEIFKFGIKSTHTNEKKTAFQNGDLFYIVFTEQNIKDLDFSKKTHPTQDLEQDFEAPKKVFDQIADTVEGPKTIETPITTEVQTEVQHEDADSKQDTATPQKLETAPLHHESPRKDSRDSYTSPDPQTPMALNQDNDDRDHGGLPRGKSEGQGRESSKELDYDSVEFQEPRGEQQEPTSLDAATIQSKTISPEERRLQVQKNVSEQLLKTITDILGTNKGEKSITAALKVLESNPTTLETLKSCDIPTKTKTKTTHYDAALARIVDQATKDLKADNRIIASLFLQLKTRLAELQSESVPDGPVKKESLNLIQAKIDQINQLFSKAMFSNIVRILRTQKDIELAINTALESLHKSSVIVQVLKACQTPTATKTGTSTIYYDAALQKIVKEATKPNLGIRVKIPDLLLKRLEERFNELQSISDGQTKSTIDPLVLKSLQLIRKQINKINVLRTERLLEEAGNLGDISPQISPRELLQEALDADSDKKLDLELEALEAELPAQDAAEVERNAENAKIAKAIHSRIDDIPEIGNSNSEVEFSIHYYDQDFIYLVGIENGTYYLKPKDPEIRTGPDDQDVYKIFLIGECFKIMQKTGQTQFVHSGYEIIVNDDGVPVFREHVDEETIRQQEAEILAEIDGNLPVQNLNNRPPRENPAVVALTELDVLKNMLSSLEQQAIDNDGQSISEESDLASETEEPISEIFRKARQDFVLDAFLQEDDKEKLREIFRLQESGELLTPEQSNVLKALFLKSAEIRVPDLFVGIAKNEIRFKTLSEDKKDLIRKQIISPFIREFISKNPRYRGSYDLLYKSLKVELFAYFGGDNFEISITTALAHVLDKNKIPTDDQTLKRHRENIVEPKIMMAVLGEKSEAVIEIRSGKIKGEAAKKALEAELGADINKGEFYKKVKDFLIGKTREDFVLGGFKQETIEEIDCIEWAVKFCGEVKNKELSVQELFKQRSGEIKEQKIKVLKRVIPIVKLFDAQPVYATIGLAYKRMQEFGIIGNDFSAEIADCKIKYQQKLLRDLEVASEIKDQKDNEIDILISQIERITGTKIIKEDLTDEDDKKLFTDRRAQLLGQKRQKIIQYLAKENLADSQGEFEKKLNKILACFDTDKEKQTALIAAARRIILSQYDSVEKYIELQPKGFFGSFRRKTDEKRENVDKKITILYELSRSLDKKVRAQNKNNFLESVANCQAPEQPEQAQPSLERERSSQLHGASEENMGLVAAEQDGRRPPSSRSSGSRSNGHTEESEEFEEVGAGRQQDKQLSKEEQPPESSRRIISQSGSGSNIGSEDESSEQEDLVIAAYNTETTVDDFIEMNVGKRKLFIADQIEGLTAANCQHFLEFLKGVEAQAFDVENTDNNVFAIVIAIAQNKNLLSKVLINLLKQETDPAQTNSATNLANFLILNLQEIDIGILHLAVRVGVESIFDNVIQKLKKQLTPEKYKGTINYEKNYGIAYLTPLMLAVDSKSKTPLTIIETLIDEGAKVEHQNDDNESAVTIAFDAYKADQANNRKKRIKDFVLSQTKLGKLLAEDPRPYNKILDELELLKNNTQPPKKLPEWALDVVEQNSGLLIKTLQFLKPERNAMGAVIHHRDPKDPQTLAAKNLVKFLIENNVKLNAKVGFGEGILYFAVNIGDQSILNEVISGLRRARNLAATIDDLDAGGSTPLMTAIECGFPQMAEILFAAGANINFVDNTGATPLIQALTMGDSPEINSGRINIARLLLKKDGIRDTINNKVNNSNNTALHLAVQAGNVKIVQKLIALRADVEAYNSNSETPIDLANQITDTSLRSNILKTLNPIKTTLTGKLQLALAKLSSTISQRRTLKTKEDRAQRLDLFQACARGDLPAVQEFIGNGVEINSKTNPALFIACQNGHVDVVEYLLEQGADYLAEREIYKNDTGKRKLSETTTPLGIACQKGHIEVVKALCEKAGSNLQTLLGPDKSGQTALHRACNGTDDSNLETVEYLLAAHPTLIDVEKKSKSKPGNKTALFIACLNNNPKIVQFLLKKDAKKYLETPCRHSNSLSTPLEIACQLGFYDVVDVLINNGATISNKLRKEVSKNRPLLPFTKKPLVNLAAARVIREAIDQKPSKKLITKQKQLGADEDSYLKARFIKACEQKNGEEALDIFHKKPNIFLTDPESFLMACKNDLANVVHILIVTGADSATPFLDPKDKNLQLQSRKTISPLEIACREGCYGTVLILISETQIPRNKSILQSSLHLACRSGHTNIVKKLMEIGATIDDKIKQDLTDESMVYSNEVIAALAGRPPEKPFINALEFESPAIISRLLDDNIEPSADEREALNQWLKNNPNCDKEFRIKLKQVLALKPAMVFLKNQTHEDVKLDDFISKFLSYTLDSSFRSNLNNALKTINFLLPNTVRYNQVEQYEIRNLTFFQKAWDKVGETQKTKVRNKFTLISQKLLDLAHQDPTYQYNEYRIIFERAEECLKIFGVEKSEQERFAKSFKEELERRLTLDKIFSKYKKLPPSERQKISTVSSQYQINIDDYSNNGVKKVGAEDKLELAELKEILEKLNEKPKNIPVSDQTQQEDVIQKTLRKMIEADQFYTLKKFVEGNGLEPEFLSEALFIACQKGNLGIVKYLIDDKGVRCDIQYSTDKFDGKEVKMSAFSAACIGGNLEIAKYLLNKTDINQPILVDGKPVTNLAFACIKGSAETIKFLLDNAPLQTNQRCALTIKGTHYPEITPLAIANAAARTDDIRVLLESRDADVYPLEPKKIRQELTIPSVTVKNPRASKVLSVEIIEHKLPNITLQLIAGVYELTDQSSNNKPSINSTLTKIVVKVANDFDIKPDALLFIMNNEHIKELIKADFKDKNKERELKIKKSITEGTGLKDTDLENEFIRIKKFLQQIQAENQAAGIYKKTGTLSGLDAANTFKIVGYQAVLAVKTNSLPSKIQDGVKSIQNAVKAKIDSLSTQQK